MESVIKFAQKLACKLGRDIVNTLNRPSVGIRTVEGSDKEKKSILLGSSAVGSL